MPSFEVLTLLSKMSEMWNCLLLNLVVRKVTTGHSLSGTGPIRTFTNCGQGQVGH